MMGAPERKIFALAAVMLLLIGVPLVWMGAANVWLAVASSGWPMTEGQVRSANVVAGNETTSAEIVVGYRVGGAEYTTDTLHFGQTVGSGDSSEAQLRAMRYAEGKKVWVRYKPSNPAIACTEPGFYGEALLLPAAGLAFGLPGAALLVVAMQWMKGSLWKHGLKLFVCAFGAIGVALLWIGLERMWLAHASGQWPEADAEIVYAQEDTSTTYRDSMRRRGPESTSFATNLVFRYEVNGQTHYSNLRRIGHLAGADEDWAYEIAERYPKGKKLKVRVQPGNPDVAVIEPGIGGEAFWLPGAGAAFFLFALLVAKFGIPALTREF